MLLLQNRNSKPESVTTDIFEGKDKNEKLKETIEKLKRNERSSDIMQVSAYCNFI
jgi:hypothetical protein